MTDAWDTPGNSAGENGDPASPRTFRKRGKTAAQIWSDHGLAPLRGGPAWLGNQLERAGCRFSDLGGTVHASRSRLFDPEKAALWMEGDGRVIVEARIAGLDDADDRARIPVLAAE